MHGQRIGYIRVSTLDQNPDRQLEGVQVSKVFIDKASGKNTQRPQLEALLSYVRDGDIERDLPLTIEESDRLVRIAHVHALAYAVFGEPAKAKRWLSKSKERFDGLAPMHLPTTQHGANMV